MPCLIQLQVQLLWTDMCTPVLTASFALKKISAPVLANKECHRNNVIICNRITGLSSKMLLDGLSTEIAKY